MDFNKVQLDYALLAANVYGAKSGVRTELNTLEYPKWMDPDSRIRIGDRVHG